MSRRVKFLVGSLLIVAAVGTLIFAAVRETSTYFMTVEEYAADPASHAGKPLRLAGRVRDGSVEWNPATLDLAFTIQPIPPKESAEHAVAGSGETVAVAAVETVTAAAASSLPVRYNGVLPDMFAAGRDVIVEGRVLEGVFHANTLLTTCPSKYEAGVKPDETQASTGSPASG